MHRFYQEKKIFLNQSYVAEVNMVIALWEQLNKDINNDLKQQILLMILKSIINDDNSCLLYTSDAADD